MTKLQIMAIRRIAAVAGEIRQVEVEIRQELCRTPENLGSAAQTNSPLGRLSTGLIEIEDLAEAIKEVIK